MGHNSSTTKTELASSRFTPAPNALKDLQAKIQHSKLALAPLARYPRNLSSRPLKMNTDLHEPQVTAHSKIRRTDLDKLKYLTISFDDSSVAISSIKHLAIEPIQMPKLPEYSEWTPNTMPLIHIVPQRTPEILTQTTSPLPLWNKHATSSNIKKQIEINTLMANAGDHGKEILGKVLSTINWVSTITTVAHTMQIDKQLDAAFAAVNFVATTH